MWVDPLTANEAHSIHVLHQVIETESFEQQPFELIERLANVPTRERELHEMQVRLQLDQDFVTAVNHSLRLRQTHVIKDRL